MWDPSILYILKGIDSSWLLLHYQYYKNYSTKSIQQRDWGQYDPRIDSVLVETYKPQKITWKTYLDSLKLDSIWNWRSIGEIKGQSFGMNDGYHVLIEIRDKTRYRQILLSNPDYFQKTDISHKKYVEFHERFIHLLGYKMLHNP
jgi:hypothetical protein